MNYLQRRCLRVAASLALACCVVSSSPAQTPEFRRLYGSVAELVNAGKIAEALPLARQLLAAASPNDPQFTTIVYRVAGLYRSLGRFDDGVALVKEVLTLEEKTLGPDHTKVGALLTVLGSIYEEDGRYADAEPVDKRRDRYRRKIGQPRIHRICTQQVGLSLSKPKPGCRCDLAH